MSEDDKTLADVDWLVGEVERLRELLGRLEWIAKDGLAVCPACSGQDPEGTHPAMLEVEMPGRQWGHTADCWLAAKLHPLPP